jgi:hypothetical protein
LLKTGALTDPQQGALVKALVKPKSILYAPAGWITMVRAVGDSQHQCGFQACFYHTSADLKLKTVDSLDCLAKLSEVAEMSRLLRVSSHLTVLRKALRASM